MPLSSKLLATPLVLLGIACLAGCPSAGGARPGGGATPVAGDGLNRAEGAAAGDEAPDTGAAGADRGATRPPVDTSCAEPPCVYHAGAGGYFSCLSAGAGTCFHYGRTCAPRDRCMFEASSGAYRTCEEPVEGRCTRFGGACEPAGGCVFDPTDGMHYRCAEMREGKCARVGDRCTPAGP